MKQPILLGVALALSTALTQVGLVQAAQATQSSTIKSVMAGTDVCTLPAGANQPAGEALTSFFCASLGLNYETIQSMHMDGFGYGEIAQACFMAEALGGGATCQSILDAKKSGDYSALKLPDGSTVSNWGQLMTLVLAGEMRSLTNLGAIMSGRAQPSISTSTAGSDDHGNKGNNGNHGHGGDHGQSGNHVP